MKIKAYVDRYKWNVPVTQIDFKNKEVEVDLTDGNGDTSNFTFDVLIGLFVIPFNIEGTITALFNTEYFMIDKILSKISGN